MSFGLQPIHLVAILLVALLVFGPSKLPEMSRNLGRAIAEFKRSSADFTSGFQNEIVAPINTAMNVAQTPNAAQPAQGTAISVPGQPQPAAASAPLQSAPQEAIPSFPCSKCGTLNAGDALFCKHCGNPFPLPTE